MANPRAAGSLWKHGDPIFVFGSCLAARPGGGTPMYARRYYDADPDVREGPSGHAYAIPVIGEQHELLSLERIRSGAERFLSYALAHPQWRFLLTPIGCGPGEYKPMEVSVLFARAPKNVIQPPEFTPLTVASR